MICTCAGAEISMDREGVFAIVVSPVSTTLRWQTSDTMMYWCIDQYYYNTGIKTNVTNTYVNDIQVLISHQHQGIVKLIKQYK